MYKILKSQKGYAIVEATVIYPITIMTFFVLLYLSLFLCQRANLQANLEDALIYYKNVGSDSYVSVDSKMGFTDEEVTVSAKGNSYHVNGKLNPYRKLGNALVKGFQEAVGIQTGESDFTKFFRSSSGHMFFDDGSNVSITYNEDDFVIYKRITATATQTVNAPINLAMVGGKNAMVISAQASVVVVDGDDMIRDIDFAGHLIDNSVVGEKIREVTGKITEFYGKLKEKLGI